MKSFGEGQLVTVETHDGPLDGIVFDAPSLVKRVVAVPDPEHGVVFRTVHPRVLTERAEGGEHDQALRRLIRRTQAAGHGAARGGGAQGRGRGGHTRGVGHRPTGR